MHGLYVYISGKLITRWIDIEPYRVIVISITPFARFFSLTLLMRPVSFSHVIKVESNYLQFGTNIIIDKKIALSIILLHAITKNILVKYFPEPPKLLSWKQNQKGKNESVQMTSYEWFTNDIINYEIVCITIYRCNWHQSNRGKNEISLNFVDDFL